MPIAALDKGDTAWVLICSAFVLLMTMPGLALFYGGMVRQRNVLSTLVQSLAALCIISLQWILFGYSLAFGPDKGGSKAYFLLSETLKRTGRVALAKYAARGKQYLVMLRPKDGGLVMQQLLYADEIRPISEIGLDREPVQDAELKLATMLVEQRSTDRFLPETYEDEVKKRIQAQLKRKIETGEEISSAPSPESGEVIDLMEALRRSLGKPSSGSRKSGPVAVAERKPARRAVRGAGEKKAAARK